jgi:hypothetical protein
MCQIRTRRRGPDEGPVEGLQAAIVAAAAESAAVDEVLRDLEKGMSPAGIVGLIEEGYYPGLGSD